MFKVFDLNKNKDFLSLTVLKNQIGSSNIWIFKDQRRYKTLKISKMN